MSRKPKILPALEVDLLAQEIHAELLAKTTARGEKISGSNVFSDLHDVYKEQFRDIARWHIAKDAEASKVGKFGYAERETIMLALSHYCEFWKHRAAHGRQGKDLKASAQLRAETTAAVLCKMKALP